MSFTNKWSHTDWDISTWNGCQTLPFSTGGNRNTIPALWCFYFTGMYRKVFFFNIQLYKVHLKCMNYLSQVGVLAILSLVIKPTVQNKSFHSKSTFQICRLPQATIYNRFPALVTYAMHIQMTVIWSILDQIISFSYWFLWFFFLRRWRIAGCMLRTLTN